MKIMFLCVLFFGTYLMSAQAYEGKGDLKFQIGANLQQNGAGITSSLDYGVGENMSLGVTTGYLLGVERTTNISGEKIADSEFHDRFDLRARFSAHIGNVLKIDKKLDFYPGLYLSLKNFGSHLGARYFFAPGIGVFSELNIPIARYDVSNLTSSEKLNNQISISIGASFNI
jgi:outer membrane protein G